jgi:trans-aconitate 2-methyltransferase
VWDPASYLRYGDERSRPFYDLTARIAADRPRVVVDLGCGPGNLTATLPGRWPTARVLGLDSSAEMIESAELTRSATAFDGAPSGASAVEFAVADVRTWAPGPEVDVVISNAVLQWVPGHEALLVRWARQLSPGSWLAVQVPGNFTAASHRALYATAEEPRWRALLDGVLRDAPVSDAVGYADLLTGADCQVDAWETTYVHLLPASGAADHPVLTWMEGTALRPVRAALGGGGGAWEAFRTDLGRRLGQAYPIRDGLVYYPFHRVFFVARTGARQ